MTKTGRPTKYPWGKWMLVGIKRSVRAAAYGVGAQYLRRVISSGAATRGMRAVTEVDGDVVRFRIVEAL